MTWRNSSSAPPRFGDRQPIIRCQATHYPNFRCFENPVISRSSFHLKASRLVALRLAWQKRLMARKHRLVVPDFPHHVIQRGSRRQRVFFSDEDRRFYLGLLKKYGDVRGLSFWAYCLMDNHVHLIVVPKTPESLPRAMSAIHWRYTLSINLREDWKGSLWQGRYRSYPMDEPYAVAAIRYIELNPVRAGIVARAESYQWSSANAHVSGQPDPIISKCYLSDKITDWASFLAQGSSESELRLLREHASTCRPLGDQSFIKRLEEITRSKIAPQRPGPKPRAVRPTSNPAGGASMKRRRELR
mgnify:CR=1 FL=1